MQSNISTTLIFSLALLTACSGTATSTATIDTGPEDTLMRALTAINDGQCSSYINYMVPALGQSYGAANSCERIHSMIVQSPQNAAASLKVTQRTVKPSETDLLVAVKNKAGSINGSLKVVMQKQNGTWLIADIRPA